ncbi:MAG: ATP-binding protein [Candidatus Omnitrophica bacterium]|nr:ATP-binding protein [Candidatus Omnitrophota bacterium]
MIEIDKIFPKGVLRPELYMGAVNTVTASIVQVDFSEANAPSGSYYLGGRYGKGEVGEFVIIEGQINLVLGRVLEVKFSNERQQNKNLDSLGRIQLLGSISMETLKVTAGIEAYPRLGDRVYAAPHKLVALIPTLMEDVKDTKVTLELGSVDVALESKIKIKPEKLFGRHLAILGSTGGGKSWTTAQIIEQCLKFNSKLILFDATGEYRDFDSNDIKHVHLGNVIESAKNSSKCLLSPTSFQESDFIALFEPAGKIQGPKFRDAIRSLRLAKLCSSKYPDGYVKKINESKSVYNSCSSELEIASKMDNPATDFDVDLLVKQLEQECVWPNGGTFSAPDYKRWGGGDGSSLSYCLSLFTRINGILSSPSLNCVFTKDALPSLIQEIEKFLGDKSQKLLRVDLSGISFEYKAREIISNVIGRYILNQARDNKFSESPLLVFLDEAHNFLGKHIGGEDTIAKLDSFELIAKEGRKFGLNICLATQRPRDITEGVLSQIGTMIVHRLTNDRDREIVERACGEIDKAASAFLPNLKPGEAAIIGNDFPIPLTIQITEPNIHPKSSGPDYQKHWK